MPGIKCQEETRERKAESKNKTAWRDKAIEGLKILKLKIDCKRKEEKRRAK